jgi:hypothetical protein
VFWSRKPFSLPHKRSLESTVVVIRVRGSFGKYCLRDGGGGQQVTATALAAHLASLGIETPSIAAHLGLLRGFLGRLERPHPSRRGLSVPARVTAGRVPKVRR